MEYLKKSFFVLWIFIFLWTILSFAQQLINA